MLGTAPGGSASEGFCDRSERCRNGRNPKGIPEKRETSSQLLFWGGSFHFTFPASLASLAPITDDGNVLADILELRQPYPDPPKDWAWDQ